MMNKELAAVFVRDLGKLKEEISLYANEADLWTVKGGISNSAGNLCLHLVGNLNHFIGAVLGNTGYIRERDLEFSMKNVARSDMLKAIDEVTAVVKSTLENLTPEQMSAPFPVEKHNQVVSMEHMLLHLFGHFSYHLGQINYHRRLSVG